MIMPEKIRSRMENAWCMYDWANSAFTTTIIAAVFPYYYVSVAGKSLDPNVATAYWGYTNTFAMLLTAVTAPVLGAIADRSGSRKKFLAALAGIGMMFSGLLALVGPGDWILASALFICGLIGWSGANVFYDSLLPHVAAQGRIDTVSSRGFALGYLGGGLLLALNLVMIQPGLLGLESFPGIPDAQWGARVSFISVAVWWAVFSAPLLARVPEPPVRTGDYDRLNPVRSGFRRVTRTIREARRHPDILLFLTAYWLYNDGIASVIVMAVAFGHEIGISQGHLIGAILAVQFVGVPFAILFGRLSGWIGAKRSIMVGLGIYCLIVTGGYFMTSPLHFWILALLVATAQGGTQALSRSLFARMAPEKRAAEFFGFYDVSAKFASIMGPFLFSTVAILTGSSRNGILALLALFVLGGGLLSAVNVERARATSDPGRNEI